MAVCKEDTENRKSLIASCADRPKPPGGCEHPFLNSVSRHTRKCTKVHGSASLLFSYQASFFILHSFILLSVYHPDINCNLFLVTTSKLTLIPHKRIKPPSTPLKRQSIKPLRNLVNLIRPLHINTNASMNRSKQRSRLIGKWRKKVIRLLFPSMS